MLKLKHYVLASIIGLTTIFTVGCCNSAYANDAVEVVESVSTETGKAYDQVKEDVSTAAEFTVSKLDEYFLKAEEVIEKYGGDAVELGLNVLRIEALSTLIPPLIGVIVCLVGIKISYKISVSRDIPSGLGSRLEQALLKAYSYRTSTDDTIIHENLGIPSREVPSLSISGNWSDFRVIWTIVAAGIGVALCVSLLHLINVWSWVGIFYPELYAVHKFIL